MLVIVVPPRILIVAAPFGFGPAAQSLILAHGLRQLAEVSFSADRDAYEFIARHKSTNINCIKGPFSRTFAHQRTLLSNFDYFVCINHFPAIQHLALHGLAHRTIFFDSLLPWRTTEAQAPTPPDLLAYLVQDYPGAGALLSQCVASTVALVAPMMWPLVNDARPDARKHIVLHLGGMTSPLAKWDMLCKPVVGLVSNISQLAAQHGLPLVVIGSPHLKSLSLGKENLNVLGGVSPEATARLINSARVLITTPGVGAVYEAMAYDTPLVLLPPMNSTQLDHYQVFTGQGLTGVMPSQIFKQMTARAIELQWEQQTLLCLKAWQLPTQSLIAGLPAFLSKALSRLGDAASLDSLMMGQRELGRALSKASTIDIVQNLVSSAAKTDFVKPSQAGDATMALSDIEQQLLLLPKVELHVHLEGSIRPELLLRFAGRHKLRLPFATPEQFYKYCVYGTFKDFSNILLLGVQCLRGLEDFFDVVLDMGANLASQNVRYAEVTWTPQFYLRRAFSLDDILGAMNQARRQLKAQWGLELRWIPDLVRSYPAPAAGIAKWAASRTQSGVVALGLGGPEAGYPAKGFLASFGEAREGGLPANPHAGEGMGPESIWETIEHLQPRRLGHGVRAVEDPALLAHLARQSLALEVCLTSNVKLGIYPSYAEHPIKRLMDAGCTVSLNSDDPVLFQTSLTQEYVHAIRHCGLSMQDVQKTILDAARSSYLGEDEKSAMLEVFQQEFAQLKLSSGQPLQ
jgi:aminodeoxyfutalosine deaminase